MRIRKGLESKSWGVEDDRGRIGLEGGANGGSATETDWIRGIEVLGPA
jgi:hypothetical protein